MSTPRRVRLTLRWLAMALSVLTLLAERTARPSPGGSGLQATGPGKAQRFPVAHEHAASWCLGFLYLTPDTVRYEVVQPPRDSRHAFEVKRSDLVAVGPWSRYNQTLNALEIKFNRLTYHFWLLPSEADVQTGRPYRFNPPDAAPAATLIAALQAAGPSAADGSGAVDSISAETPGPSAAGGISDLAPNGLAPSGGNRVLVEGNPPLTQQVLDRVAWYFAWLFETPITSEQKVLFERYLVGCWQKHNQEDVKGALDLAEAYEKIKHMPPEQQQLVRQEALPANLAELRKGSADATGSQITRSMVAIYDASHKPIAPGNPPLTRQMTDAYVEVTYFMLTEATGRPLPPLTAEIRDQWAQGISQGYASLSDAQRKQIDQMPRLAAALRVWWPTVPEAQKTQYRQTWKQSLLGTQTQAAAPSAQPGANPSKGSKTAAEIMRESQMQHQSFTNMMNFSMQMHYSTFNSINTMGGNPYRVVNAYGNPY